MARQKKYKHVVITDEKCRPMVWIESQKQLVYCTDEHWQDKHTPVQFYTVKKAQRLIKKTIDNRNKWKMSPGKYKTMPFELTAIQARSIRNKRRQINLM